MAIEGRPRPRRAGRILAPVAAVLLAGGVTALAVSLHGRDSSAASSASRSTGTSPGLARLADADPAALASIECSAADTCLAVGYRGVIGSSAGTRSLVASWNSAGWAVIPVADTHVDDQLVAVGCASARTCVAVGSTGSSGDSRSGNATALTRNGTAWTRNPPGAPGAVSGLDAVTCTAAPLCIAVGSSTDHPGGHMATLVETWDGTAWSTLPSPAPGTDSWLNGIACGSAISCVAVGGFSDASPLDEDPDSGTLIESWNGSTWTVVPSPDPGTGGEGALLSVACPTPVWCVAVGSYGPVNNPYHANNQTLVETWDGRSWSVVPSPSPGMLGVLKSVTCTSASSCVAVGSYLAPGAALRRQALVETWDGRAWSPEALPPTAGDRAGTSSQELASVACPSATSCIAVGVDTDTHPLTGPRSLVVRGDGRGWSIG